MTAKHFSEQAIARVTASGINRFERRNPRSAALAARARDSLYGGVPMHWMADWPMPFPLFVDHAQGARFTDVDGNAYADFCLGDTGAMFGHAPAPVAQALREQATRGYTTMLPGEDAVWVGEELSRRFGMDLWQVAATATDANRYALRWARAVTGRKRILVFDGCYHGTVDETMVRLAAGRTVPRPGQLGSIIDVAATTAVVEFNDLEALATELRKGDIAAVIAEPAMTNIGMVLPDAGFHQHLRNLTREAGTLLVIDETHTISTGPGGWTRAHGLEPDIFVLGKPVAGGIPCAVFGVTRELAARMSAARAAKSADGHGHSGMGTTLSANALAMHAMRANLSQVMTQAAYDVMLSKSERLRAALDDLIRSRNLGWTVTRIGARCEFQFSPVLPRTGREAELAFHDSLEKCLHLGLINRGVMITPFHNMMLVCPQTEDAGIDSLVLSLGQIIEELENA